MLNLPEDLPPLLEEKLRRRSRSRPEIDGLVMRLVEKRASTDSEKERAAIEKMLWSLAEPSRKGVFLAGAICAVVVAVLAANMALDAHERSAVDAGIETVARVKRLEPGNCWFGSKKSSCVRLTLEVHPTGQATYVAEVTDLVPNMYLPRVQSGAWLFVSVDRKDATEVLLDEERLAEPAPGPVDQPGLH